MTQGVREIAKLAGVSVATVSRVVNGSSKVTEKTREKVEAAMRQLNYTPDAAARALATKRSRIIGALVPTIDHSIFARFIEAMESVLTEGGYALVIALTYNRQDQEAARAQDLIKLGAEGLIVSGLEHDRALLDLVAGRNIPLICTSVFDAGSPLPTIGYDNRALAAEAAGYLKGLGHEKLAVVHGPIGNNDRTRRRIEGIRSVYGEADLEMVEVPLSIEGGTRAAETLFGKGEAGSAVFCLSDVLAQGVMATASRHGISIPDQLSVMGFDNLEWSALSHPRLTTIDLPVAEMGRKSAKAIIGCLEAGFTAESQCLTGRIIERETTGPGH